MRMRKCRTLRGGATTVYPPSTHDYLIEQAFPRLGEAYYRSAVKSGSRAVDVRFKLVPVTLIESNAPKHAMTPSTKVKELIDKGMSPEQAEKEARIWAKETARRFVDDAGVEARSYFLRAEGLKNPTRKRGLMTKSYQAFGRGAHTLMDNVSPAHNDFKVYSAPWNEPNVDLDPVRNASVKAGTFIAEMVQHGNEEGHEPSRAELQQTIYALHNF